MMWELTGPKGHLAYADNDKEKDELVAKYNKNGGVVTARPLSQEEAMDIKMKSSPFHFIPFLRDDYKPMLLRTGETIMIGNTPYTISSYTFGGES